VRRYIAATFVTIIVTVLLTSAAVVWAQDDEVTLAGLAEQVTGLAGQVTALVDRVTALEERLAPAMTETGVCVQYADGQIQRETVTAYLATFEEDVDSSLISLEAVHYDSESGLTTYNFEELFADRSVTETWNGCEFVGVGEWVEE